MLQHLLAYILTVGHSRNLPSDSIVTEYLYHGIECLQEGLIKPNAQESPYLCLLDKCSENLALSELEVLWKVHLLMQVLPAINIKNVNLLGRPKQTHPPPKKKKNNTSSTLN